MTYDQPPTMPPSMYAPPQAKPRRTKLTVILAAIAVALLILVGVILYAAGVFPGGGLSKESAERACRTAVGDEWQKRLNVAGSGMTTDIVPSVQSIEMLDTYEVQDGYAVNATVHYTLTTALIAPVQGTIDLTCTATGSDDNPETSVENRS